MNGGGGGGGNIPGQEADLVRHPLGLYTAVHGYPWGYLSLISTCLNIKTRKLLDWISIPNINMFFILGKTLHGRNEVANADKWLLKALFLSPNKTTKVSLFFANSHKKDFH